jgi:large repetitive protein
VTFEEEFIPGPCPSRYSLNRTWTASDDCGNSISATQFLTVVDTTGPEWIGDFPPAQMTVNSCDDIPEPVALLAVDNCDGETYVIFNEFFSPSAGCSDVCECGGVVVRTWISSDCMGNMATFVQYFNVLNGNSGE